MLATAGVSSGLTVLGNLNTDERVNGGPITLKPVENDAFKISIFSKHLQWLDYTEMAEATATMGFDGIDLSVRPGGHVLPENVVDDLPKAMRAITAASLNVYMITTAITDPDDPLTEKIIKTASSLGIRHYRMGWFKYDDKKTIEENLSEIKSKMFKIAELNKRYSISGEYQNHAGTYFGAPIWDLHRVLKEIDSPSLGIQYDIRHATVEGSTTWPVGLKLIKPYIKSFDIKDFQWTKKDNKWIAENVPVGQGMVDFKRYFQLLKAYDVKGPISLHYEYPLGGAEHGGKTLTMERTKVLAAMKRDLLTIKDLLRDSGI